MNTSIRKGMGKYYELSAYYGDLADVRSFAAIESAGQEIRSRVEGLKDNLPEGTKCLFGDIILDWEHRMVSVAGDIQVNSPEVLDAIEVHFLHKSLSDESRKTILKGV